MYYRKYVPKYEFLLRSSETKNLIRKNGLVVCMPLISCILMLYNVDKQNSEVQNVM